ncbi:MAG: ribonuclease III [Opitutaceae bacterium]|nr:ribonuclease III [Opitutaceae bacterium]
MNAPLSQLQQRIGYQFERPALLELAMTHPSLNIETSGPHASNQRLEFLGDAVLQLILSEEIYRRFPTEREGALTQNRKKLIEGSFTARLALELGVDACLRVQAAASDLATSQGALEDAFEALVAAIYLDAGFERCRVVVLGLYGDIAPHLAAALPSDNPKGRLQERVQPRYGNQALRYKVADTSGPDHAREFTVALYLNDTAIAVGHGTSKQRAEEAAAHTALENWPPAGVA